MYNGTTESDVAEKLDQIVGTNNLLKIDTEVGLASIESIGDDQFKFYYPMGESEVKTREKTIAALVGPQEIVFWERQ